MSRLVLCLCGTLALAGCSGHEPPAPIANRTATADAHGFGENIPWEPLEGALAHAKQDGMPVMLVVHASWCSRCKELKPAFSNPELAALSQHFIMVNADQDLEPKVLEYAPDGEYIPRVVFLSPEGIEDLTLTNEARQRHRYFYTPADDLLGVMRKALTRHERHPPRT